MPADTTSIINTTLGGFILFSIVVFVAIVAVMVFFVVRYHHKRNKTPSEVSGNVWLELVWLVVPTLIGVGMFFYGLSAFNLVTHDQTGDALVVKVRAFEYGWEFEYPNGVESSYLEVPLGHEVALDISSEDVIHSFYAPDYRIKMDAVPGMTTHLRFDAHEVGSFPVICAEYCGIGHSDMATRILVVPEEEFTDWYEKQAAEIAVADSD